MLLRQWPGREIIFIQGNPEHIGLYYSEEMRASKANRVSFEELIIKTEFE